MKTNASRVLISITGAIAVFAAAVYLSQPSEYTFKGSGGATLHFLKETSDNCPQGTYAGYGQMDQVTLSLCWRYGDNKTILWGQGSRGFATLDNTVWLKR